MPEPSGNPESPDQALPGENRLREVLQRHAIATIHTLEQKISAAGPARQRVEPRPLRLALDSLAGRKEVVALDRAGAPWYRLRAAPPPAWRARLEAQAPIFEAVNAPAFALLLAQALEIAAHKALRKQSRPEPLGGFKDLSEHDDSAPYSREDPPELGGGEGAPPPLSLLVQDPDHGRAGILVRNARPWLYPDSEGVREALLQCCAVDAVPVLVARRIALAEFSGVLGACGIILHQTYHQRYPRAFAELAEYARHKTLLGYSDIRLGNEPDARLMKFFAQSLPAALPEARRRFQARKDLLLAYGEGKMGYGALCARLGVRRGVEDRGEEEEPGYLDRGGIWVPRDKLGPSRP